MYVPNKYDLQQNTTISNLNLDSLTDVTITAPTLSNNLIYNGSQWVNKNPPRFDVYWDNNATGNGALLNQYFSVKGTLQTKYAVDFTIGANSTFTYTGNHPIRVSVIFTGTLFTSTDNRTIATIAIKNGVLDPAGVFALPNLPVGYILGSLVRGNGRNLTGILTSITGQFTTTMATGDYIRFHSANISSGDSSSMRDWRVKLDTIEYL